MVLATKKRNEAVTVLGIDPGLQRTGWGIITLEGTKLCFVACGVISSEPQHSLAERLCELHNGLSSVIADYQPDEAAVEETFVNKDARSTLKLGHARGIALLVPALSGLSVAEYAANLVKKTVVGSGHAEKSQIQSMIKILLPKAPTHQADAADALAIAITHAHHRHSRDLIQNYGLK